MNLKNSLYTIVKETAVDKHYTFDLNLDKDHKIYKGHFPGFPVTPGVIQMKIIHELVEYKTGQKFNLTRATRAKFLRPIDPTKTSGITVNIKTDKTRDGLNISAEMLSTVGKHSSYRALFEEVEE